MICRDARSIRDIDEERWDSITGEVLSMTHRWFRVMESSWRFHEPRYLLLEDAQGPCAAVVTDLYVSFKNLGGSGWLRQRLSLAVRPPFSSMCGVMVRPNVSLEALMPQIMSALGQACRQEKRFLITVSNVNLLDLPSWQQAGFSAISQPSLNLLELPSGYDLYLKSLRSKDQSELRRIRKRVTEFDIHFEMGPLANDGGQIYSLLCEVFAHHGTRPKAMPFSPQFFVSLEREMPGDVLFLRGFIGKTLAGVSLCLLNGPTLWWPMAGLRYELARPSYLYFLLMDEMIQWSIEHHITKIVGGKTAEREKKRHGFHQEERWLCYRGEGYSLNKVLALASPLIQRLNAKEGKE
jgi:predicted N-acyltransferase